jgi:hypothetical protein
LVVALTRRGRLVAVFALGGLVLLLVSALYLIYLIISLNPDLVGADAIAVKVLGAIGLLATGGIVITIRLLR